MGPERWGPQESVDAGWAFNAAAAGVQALLRFAIDCARVGLGCLHTSCRPRKAGRARVLRVRWGCRGIAAFRHPHLSGPVTGVVRPVIRKNCASLHKVARQRHRVDGQAGSAGGWGGVSSRALPDLSLCLCLVSFAAHLHNASPLARGSPHDVILMCRALPAISKGRPFDIGREGPAPCGWSFPMSWRRPRAGRATKCDGVTVFPAAGTS